MSNAYFTKIENTSDKKYMYLKIKDYENNTTNIQT